jgi:hypothetical protein
MRKPVDLLGGLDDSAQDDFDKELNEMILKN